MQALTLVQQDLEGKREELHQEVIRSTKYKNVHLKIQDAISEVSDCMTPAGSSRCVCVCVYARNTVGMYHSKCMCVCAAHVCTN